MVMGANIDDNNLFRINILYGRLVFTCILTEKSAVTNFFLKFILSYTIVVGHFENVKIP